MGSVIRPLLFAALLAPAPVLAQQTETPPASTTPAPNPDRQGPELNVFRDSVTPPTAPPVVAPTVQPLPQSTPAPTRATPARATTATPRQPTPEPRAQRPAERAAPPPAQTPAAATPAPATQAPAAPATDSAPTNQSAPVEAAPPPLPAPATNAVETPVPAPALAPADEAGNPLPWIIGGVLALVALAAAMLLRRRRPAAPIADAAPAAAPSPVETAPQPTPRPAAPAATPAATPAPVATDRPWLDMDMAVGQARYSMVGVTIAYSLILHNRGTRPAQDILIRGIIGNAGAQQAALLQDFFAGDSGLPLHSAVAIAPGETRQLIGELRLSPEEILPVTMGQRSLLIPLAAFDMAYRWDAEEPGQGRTARAFIVGQEQEPPADRLAPLRLDQGPRQYRRPAARAAAELTPA
ncbi:hypothetical protein [Sphingobium sp. CAP-1]|uniref:hypothetical protein n=1 Tax=Sphingobium sp. CAP-1 TaxID=2676077 RepID=UPI0012BB212B|nr:hypothetical protein [Sphingobium sp. CAP-1]QGP79914.1 hypothetical protein GL174_13675 [Sphingobium sp. CAP-1]